MPRYRLDIEYDGRPFRGWQYQSDALTVQGVIEAALFALTGATIRVNGAGRTDAGVHALGQVAHADLPRPWAPGRLRDGINAMLRPHPVSILGASEVADGFDARFSARGRAYRYLILDRRSPPALDSGLVWHARRRLDANAMNHAARHLLGHHDFTTFRNVDCQAKSPMKTLRHLAVRRNGDQVIVEVEARSFLHNQVRSMVGSLKRVGEGTRPDEWIAEILEARSRDRCGALAPPDGLYLTSVSYAVSSQAGEDIADPADEEAEGEV
ncbi:MAG: tRNA pseudouridine(38-40) synthase TruA [Hyphomicrobiales bacterium]|nr:tRNA pseudouridine(38-40) synthase TruA [Hyphomicrobiales bacterium]OQW84643.1 MAG: tRNA pseudouridine(38-40) synthase TruA [Proteobacteria bacterium ST_bin15]